MEGKTQGEIHLEAAKKWLAGKGNTSKIEFVKKDEKNKKLVFRFSKDDLKFEIEYPDKGDDVWHVSSEDLAEDFEGFVNGTHIDEALKFATTQYSAMSDEEFSGGSDDEGDGDGDGVDEDDSMWAPIDTSEKREKPKPEPEIDTSKFRIPVGYEPAAVMAIVKQLQSIMAEAQEWTEKEYEAGPVNDDISQWEVKLYGIPKDEPLWADMKQVFEFQMLSPTTLTHSFILVWNRSYQHACVVPSGLSFQRSVYPCLATSFCLPNWTRNSGWRHLHPPSYKRRLEAQLSSSANPR